MPKERSNVDCKKTMEYCQNQISCYHCLSHAVPITAARAMESSLALEKEQILPKLVDTTSRNRSFYDGLWSCARLADPSRFNTWPLIQELLPQAQARLEIGPGLRPRLPIPGSHFVDLSPSVVDHLKSRGGRAESGSITALPFPASSFDLVCAFDIVEHVDDDLLAFAELARILKPGGALLFSVPLHPQLWTAFDDFVGHVRRYDPDRLFSILDGNRFSVERSARFGMQPANPRLLELGIWLLTHQRTPAMFCYNWLILPISLRLQKKLEIQSGVPDPTTATELLLVCRRS
jgi:SAM-dependent methyltransferase